MERIKLPTPCVNHQDTKAPRFESSKAWCLGVLVVILFCLAFSVTLAQEVTGTIDGLVKDSSDAAIPGAEVTALHIATSTARKTVSGDDGSYVFTALPIGTYDLSVSLPNVRAQRAGLKLEV